MRIRFCRRSSTSLISLPPEEVEVDSVVVLDDYGQPCLGAKLEEGRILATRAVDPDFHKILAALGIDAVKSGILRIKKS